MKKEFLKNNNRGFTIIELMIATTVFSVILLVTSAGVIAIGRAYYKSLTSTRVQEAARSVMDDISRSLQFSGNGAVYQYNTDSSGNPVVVKAKCFGSDRYTYQINNQITGTNNGILRDVKPAAGCQPSDCFNQLKTGACANAGQELLGTNMRLLQFDLSGSPPTLRIRMAYGDNDLLSVYDDNNNPVGWTAPIDNTAEEATMAGAVCRAGIAGSNFCAISALETSVTSRVE